MFECDFNWGQECKVTNNSCYKSIHNIALPTRPMNKCKQTRSQSWGTMLPTLFERCCELSLYPPDPWANVSRPDHSPWETILPTLFEQCCGYFVVHVHSLQFRYEEAYEPFHHPRGEDALVFSDEELQWLFWVSN